MMVFINDNLRMALDSLRSNPLRSLLTTLGIVIGIATVIAILSVVEGVNLAFARELSTIGSNVIYIQKWKWGSNDWNLTRKWKDIGYHEVEAVTRGATEAEFVTPMARSMKTVKFGSKKIEDTLINGVGDHYQEIRDAYTVIGRFLSPQDIQRSRDVIVVGWEVAEELFGNEYPVGKPLNVGGHQVTVVGVLEKRGDFFDMNLDRTAVMPIGSFMKYFGSRHGLTIVTGNDRNFQRPGLKVFNPFKELPAA